MTKFIKKREINCKWYEIDAKNAVVGRLAAIITKIIRGKNMQFWGCSNYFDDESKCLWKEN